MAAVKYNALVTSFRGSIGNLTFSGSVNKTIVRTKPYAEMRMDHRAITVRAAFAAVFQSWANLSTADYDAYKTFFDTHGYPASSVTGATLTLFQAYMAYNCLRYQGFGGVLSPANFAYFSGVVNPAPTLSHDGPALNCAFHSSVDSHFMISIYASFFNASKQKVNQLVPKYLASFSLSGTSGSVGSPYIDAFGSLPPTGSFVMIRCNVIPYFWPYLGYISPSYLSTVL